MRDRLAVAPRSCIDGIIIYGTAMDLGWGVAWTGLATGGEGSGKPGSDREHLKHKVQIDGIVSHYPQPLDHEAQIDWGELRRLLEFACSVDVAQFAFPLTPASFTSCHQDECRSMDCAGC